MRVPIWVWQYFLAERRKVKGERLKIVRMMYANGDRLAVIEAKGKSRKIKV